MAALKEKVAASEQTIKWLYEQKAELSENYQKAKGTPEEADAKTALENLLAKAKVELRFLDELMKEAIGLED